MSFILLVCSFKALAQVSEILDDERVLVLREDDPRILLNMTREIIKRGPQGQEKLWVRAVWAEAPVALDFGEKGATPDDRITARHLAHELRLVREALDLQLDSLLEQKKHSMQKDFEQLLAQAQALRQPLAASRILREHAFWLYERGDMLAAIQLQKKSADLLNSIPNVPAIERLRLKIDMAMVLDTEGQPERALQLYQEIAAHCDKQMLRSLCITNAHEMGLHYSSSKDPEDWAKAEAWFKNAMQQARPFRDEWTIAKGHAALARLYAKLQRYQEAIAMGRQAVTMFDSFDNDLWSGDAYKKLGIAYLGAKQHEEAMAALHKAEKLIPADYLYDQSEIHQMLALAYESQGQTHHALHHLKKFTELSQKLKAENEVREYSKAMVDLGLRVEEERNRTLKAENDSQSQRLKDAEHLRFLLMISLILAAVAIASLLLAANRSRQLRRGELHMRRILQQIQEGILTFDDQLRIRAGYSQYVEKVFGKPLHGRHILRDVLASAPFTTEDMQIFQEVLTLSMSEGPLTWELNQHLLPVELIWQNERILSLQWQPIFGSRGRMSSILLSFRDMTHQKELMQQVAFERLRGDRITRCLQELTQLGPIKASRMFQDTRDFLSSCPKWLSDRHGAEIFRRLHTLKGLARSLGLRDLAQAAHDFEDIFVGREPDPAELQQSLVRFQACFDDYVSLESHVTLAPRAAMASEQSLFSSLDHLLPGLRRRCLDNGLDFQGVVVRDFVRHWPSRVVEKLESIFVHAMNNAIDHGYLQPRKEGQVVDSVCIEVDAEQDAGGIRLVIRDYGRGIAWSKLRERAQAMGKWGLSDHELTHLVFADGLSTTETVTNTSGRGVGMSAVQSLCHETGGSLQFQPNDRGPGAMLSLHWPQPRAA
ncbi:MAG TPA: tetratricopeptide repeat protein [Oligoflexus sp.]|uniref:tetratricopeptide repeat protein n=1 Tax=Oligoflexus sp. TaxID=1971216 RepID=UPI002D4F399A|nr:tetratricopeptide repeat protein [Oligoflexus sp.]HYX35536.1 tetratricopeptide repeat protein [Oligoflexus sp.]